MVAYNIKLVIPLYPPLEKGDFIVGMFYKRGTNVVKALES